MSIFRKCHIKLFLIIQVGHPFRLWLHFYSVFGFSPKSVFHYFGLSWARLEKCIVQSAENFKEHRFIFLTFFEFWNLISRIFIFQGPENRFWGLGTFLGCPKIIHLFTILKIFYEFGLIRGISWSYICYRENPDFSLIELPIELPIGSCYSGVE